MTSPVAGADATSPGAPQRYFDALTGLRGLAAVAVFLFHWADAQADDVVPVPAFRYGYLGVDVFFMLSGFVMAHAKYDQFAPARPRAYASFLREFMGRVSFSFYMVHWPAIFLWLHWSRGAAPAFSGVAVFLLALASAYVVYVMLERPSQRWARRLNPSSRARIPAVAGDSVLP